MNQSYQLKERPPDPPPLERNCWHVYKDSITKLNKEESKMAKKKTVKFKKLDGMLPRKSTQPGGPFELRLPIAVELQAHGTVKSFALGLSCELPVLVVRDSEAVFFAPGQELRVSIENKRDDQLSLGPGEVVAKAYVLDNSDLELAE